MNAEYRNRVLGALAKMGVRPKAESAEEEEPETPEYPNAVEGEEDIVYD